MVDANARERELGMSVKSEVGRRVVRERVGGRGDARYTGDDGVGQGGSCRIAEASAGLPRTAHPAVLRQRWGRMGMGMGMFPSYTWLRAAADWRSG